MIQNVEFILTGSADKVILGDHTYDDQHTNQETIIFIHGFKGFKDWGTHQLVAQYFARKGYRFMKFNLSHSGVNPDRPEDITDLASFGLNTISYELADLNTVINYTAHTAPSSKITLIGHSRGGGLGIIRAANDPRISRLVTWSAIADFSSLWNTAQEEEWEKSGTIYVENARTKQKMPLNFALLEDFRNHKEEYNILSAAEQVDVPWLIIHGGEDVNVPLEVAQQLAQQQPNAHLKIIEGANHVFGGAHPYTGTTLPPQLLEACEATLQFIEENK